MHIYILVPASGIVQKGGTYIPSHMTKRICDRAAELYRTLSTAHNRAHVVATTGNSLPHDNCWVANDVTRPYLEQIGVPISDIRIECSRFCDTDGEITELIELLKKETGSEEVEIYVVAKWWHIPRIRFLFWYRLPDYFHRQITIRCVPIGSWAIPRAALEVVAIPHNWIRALFRKNP